MLKMTIFLAILAAVLFSCLTVVSGFLPFRSKFSGPELARRAKKGDVDAKLDLRRLELSAPLESALMILRSLLVVAVSLLLVGAFGWGWGILASFVGVILYLLLASTEFVGRISNDLFTSYEPSVLNFIDRYKKLFLFFGSTTNGPSSGVVYSRDELVDLLARSNQAVTASQRKMLISVLEFGDAKASQVMTPRDKINSVSKDEFLGPLVLDELHSLGTSRLPVVDGDINKIVGILNLRSMLSLDIKKSTTAEEAMDPNVHFVKKGDKLSKILSLFLKTRTHLFIVTDESGKTAGLITLEDVIERLIGTPIVDEDGIGEN